MEAGQQEPVSAFLNQSSSSELQSIERDLSNYFFSSPSDDI